MSYPHFSPYGFRLGTGTDEGPELWVRNPHGVATRAALKALDGEDILRAHGQEVYCHEDGSRWRYHDLSVVAPDEQEQLVMLPTLFAEIRTAPNRGRWCRQVGVADLRMPIGFATADAAVLLTVPTGCRLLVRRGYWEVTTAFTGGASAAIGAAGPSPHDTAGDLHGGAGGDVLADLTAGVRAGTVGADLAAGVLLVPGDTVTFDRVASAFTAGAGALHLVVEILRSAGE